MRNYYNTKTEAHLEWLDAEGAPLPGVFDEFFNWLYDRALNLQCTAANFDNALKCVHNLLNVKFAKGKMKQLLKNYIRSIPTVSHFWDKMREQRTKSVWTNTDVQAALQRLDMPKKKQLAFSSRCHAQADLDMCALYGSQTCAEVPTPGRSAAISPSPSPSPPALAASPSHHHARARAADALRVRGPPTRRRREG